MARPRKSRAVEMEPGVTFFKPQGIPLRVLEQVVITVDELEALRLSDLQGLTQEEVAQQMQVSRPTVTRMLARAHQAVADALVNGKAIRIEGGDYTLGRRSYRCPACGLDLAPAGGKEMGQVCCQCACAGMAHEGFKTKN
jgi:predicted DNA-binding protein (UPF0251 family)